MFTAKETVSDLLYYDKKPVLELYIEYPQVSGPFSKFSEEKFNSYYLKKARRENRYARENVYFETVREYKALKKEGFPFMLNSYRSTFEEEFSSEKYVSLTFDLYTFTGGAHGFTERTADTWDMKRGERVGLSEVCRECTPEKNIAAVSYTHLDVYKRQTICTLLLPLPQWKQAKTYTAKSRWQVPMPMLSLCTKP